MFEVTSRGDVHLCVSGWVECSIGNLQLQSAEAIWNGGLAQEFRKSILDGTYRFCHKDVCPWLNSPDEIGSPFVDEPPELPPKPTVVNASYDKTCNLSCTSCRRFTVVDLNYQRHKVLRSRIEDIGELEEIIFIGSGDPFVSKHTKDWLFLSEVNAKRIYIHTNGYHLNQKTWERILPVNREKIRSIEVSVDAAKEDTYQTIRRGSNWKVVRDNLDFISSLRKTGAIDYYKLSFVVQACNFQETPAFAEMGLELGADEIYFSRLEDWGSYTCGCIGEYQVHLENNPLRKKLAEVLKHPALQDPRVRIGNLRSAVL